MTVKISRAHPGRCWQVLMLAATSVAGGKLMRLRSLELKPVAE